MSKFVSVNNQVAFEKWQAIKQAEGMKAPSVNQYRSAVYTLEDMAMGELSSLTVAQVDMAREANKTKTNHMNAFVVESFTNGLVDYDKSVVLHYMAERERKATAKLLDMEV